MPPTPEHLKHKIKPVPWFTMFCGLGVVIITAMYAGQKREEERPTIPTIQRLMDAPTMQSRIFRYVLREKHITPDGNCQFRALADQLMQDQSRYGDVRKAIASWLQKNEKYPIDESGTVLGDFLDRTQYPSWDAYCRYIATNKSWGDHLSLVAATETFGVNLWIMSDVDIGDTKTSESGYEPFITVITPRNTKASSSLLLAHYQELHYTSLWPQEPLESKTAFPQIKRSDQPKKHAAA